MSFDLEKICWDATSSSSSCARIFCDNDFNKCNPPCCCSLCCRQCTVDSHTHEILKRICNKLFNNYNRKKCRENFTVFGGGNSMFKLEKSPKDQQPCNCLCGPNAINKDPCVKKNKKGKQREKDDKNNSGDKDNKGGKEDGKSGFASASAVGKTTNKRDKDANAKKETNKKPTNKKNENLKNNEEKSKRIFRKKNSISIRISKNGKKLMKDRLPNRFDEVRICDVMRVELEYRDLCRCIRKCCKPCQYSQV